MTEIESKTALVVSFLEGLETTDTQTVSKNDLARRFPELTAGIENKRLVADLFIELAQDDDRGVQIGVARNLDAVMKGLGDQAPETYLDLCQKSAIFVRAAVADYLPAMINRLGDDKIAGVYCGFLVENLSLQEANPLYEAASKHFLAVMDVLGDKAPDIYFRLATFGNAPSHIDCVLAGCEGCEVRQAALDQFSAVMDKLGNNAVDTYCRLATFVTGEWDERWAVREAAAKYFPAMMDRLGDKTRDIYCSLAADEHYKVHMPAIQHFPTIMDNLGNQAPDVYQTLTTSENDTVRESAARLLKSAIVVDKLGGEVSLTSFKKLAGDPNPSVRSASAHAIPSIIGLMGAEDAENTCIALATDGHCYSDLVRQLSFSAVLGKLGDKVGPIYVKAAQQSPTNYHVCEQFSTVMSSLGDEAREITWVELQKTPGFSHELASRETGRQAIRRLATAETGLPAGLRTGTQAGLCAPDGNVCVL